MSTIAFREEESAALRHGRFQHPDPRVHVRMEALYLRSQGVATGEILRLGGISKASFHRSLNASVAGGIEPLTRTSMIVRRVNWCHTAPRLKPISSSIHPRRWPKRRPRSPS